MEITYAARKTSHEKLFLMFNNTTFLASTKPCFRFSAVLLPLLSFSFIANGFCLVAVLRSKPSTSSQRPNSVRIIHFLVCALSISDTLSLGLQCLMPLTSFFNCGWWGGQLSCDLFGYLSTVVFVWSTWIVVIMAFQRFMATVFPFHYRQHLTTNTVRNSLGVLFLVYSVHTAPPFFGVGEFVLYEDSQFCSYEFDTNRAGGHRVSGRLRFWRIPCCWTHLVLQYLRDCYIKEDKSPSRSKRG